MRVCQRFKSVIVTLAVLLALFKFLHVDIQSTGHTLSRPWSRQPNYVMSEIECAQLHSELFRRTHSTRQSHGLFALAKRLSLLDDFVTTNFGTRAPRARAPWSKILATPLLR